MFLELDAAAYHWTLAHRSPLLDPLMIAFSYFGAYAWIVLAVLMGIARPRKWPGVFQVILAIGLSTLLTDTILKPFVGRTRPYVDRADVQVIGVRLTNASFPSTHASNAFAGAYAMSSVFPAARPIVWGIAAVASVARVYVGVHYPLDVAFGGLVGLAAAAFVVGGTRWRDGSRPVTV
jgi:undecaprenyl-diphosphatase